MKVILQFKLCLLACSVLAGAPALADPIFTTQSFGTVNSIEFSFMEYSSAPSTELPDVQPPKAELPSIVIDPDDIPPPKGGNPGQPGASLPIGAPQAPEQQDPVLAADVPEPASLALLGIGLIGIALRRRA